MKGANNMCVAYPGVVERLEGKTALVNFRGNVVKVAAGFVNPKVGERVLVHAGYIMQVVSQSEAEELEQLLEEVGE